MITKDDWRAANLRLMAEQRDTLGEPPSNDQLHAYMRGELAGEDEARVREYVACHPDVARALVEPFPATSEVVSDAEFAEHWTAMQRRMGIRREGGRVLQFWRIAAALAAALAVVFGALLWQTTSRMGQPQVWEEQILLPDGRRGAGGDAAVLTARGESVVLIASLIGPRDFERYRLDLIDVSENRTVWSSLAAPPRENDFFSIVVPRRFLEPGTYRLEVHGLDGTAAERLATYSLRVPE